ncbi:MAG TPA: LPS export ABC transporter permease LptG [Alphaproteobacteria bacterium]|nr:LPS export ABC transporter permease LptG [Alphaproteobacteria bacterium]HAJ48255.1 LPS export ABC transporter permease LptG [Alphaproteobacteria bacterium]
MNWSWTLSRYLALQFLTSVMIVFGGCVALGFIIDVVELFNRTSGKDNIGVGTVFFMALLKLPNLTEKMMPFAVLFGALWTFTRLTRSQELVIARASGVSAWQFLAPPLAIALVLGAFMTMVYNPIAAQMVARYQQLEARYIRGRPSLLEVSTNGLWLRQGDEPGQSVIHALRVSDQGLQLQDVMILIYQGKDLFTGRIDAKSAILRNGFWDLTEAWVTAGGQPSVYHPKLQVTTKLTATTIQESFATPDTISFWDLPRFIAFADAAGFKPTNHRLHWHALLASPLLLCAMIFTGAAFSLRLARLGGAARLILMGVLTGFLLYFFTNASQALGKSGTVPVELAAWAPALTALLFGMTAVFNQEDG